MILIDTSAWVEFLRGTESATHKRVRGLLDDEIATCEAVRMEVLAGARSERHRHEIGRLLARARTLETLSVDYDVAAVTYRSCRRGGESPRSLVDCLIAAVAIRAGVALLHADRDFDVIARHSRLETITTL